MGEAKRQKVECTRDAFDAFWSENNLQRVALLKAIEAATAEVFEKEVLAHKEVALQTQMRAVVLESNMAGIEEFGELWFVCIKAKMDRMTLCADWIGWAMQHQQSGFDQFERALVTGAAKLLPAYHQYYLDYLAAVQNEAVVKALAANPPDDAELLSSYTCVRLDEKTGELTSAPFATHFESALGPVLAGFDCWIEGCVVADSAVNASGAQTADWSAESRQSYIRFLKQYKACLGAKADAVALEAMWTELDRVWMDTRMPIQLVHDIETGYGDPLRTKATPDVSLRFLDETFSAQNQTIADIQQRMMAYYKTRDTELSKGGLTALANTMAGIYFIPFKTGISLQFSFSGQSIPNRVAVKEEKGVKIYFDAVETAARVEINKKLICRCYHNAEQDVLAKFEPEATEQLVWHVAAHEVGHAIYNLASVEGLLSVPAYKSLLEEPRAELTAMFTLKLLFEQQVLSRDALDKALAHFALDALRYFDKYDSEALRPYVIFQVYSHKVYQQQGFLSVHPESGKLVIDTSATLTVLDTFSECFLRLLDCMDNGDGAGLESILWSEMAPEDAFVRSVVSLVEGDGARAPHRPERNCTCHPSWALPLCMECGP